ncbi:MAG TPA: hypothetical protein DD638_07150 [Pasteurellaceae bacterium]|nr:hypothetical protein [Pasteurellaceae bacterium]
MSRQINLLPWRLKLHHHRSRILLWKLFILVFMVIALMLTLRYLNRQISAELTVKQIYSAQTQGKLRHIEQQISQLQKNYIKQESYTLITSAKAIRILDFLSQLPMRQGELKAFILRAEQLTLAGTADNQTEFEQINRFLTESALFKQVILAKFIPQQNGSLQFQFMLILEEKE